MKTRRFLWECENTTEIPGGDTNKKKKVLAFFFVSVGLKKEIGMLTLKILIQDNKIAFCVVVWKCTSEYVAF
jgi:hypothetical protein